MPVVSISGTNGKSTTTRMISHILGAAGRRVGATTSDGVLIDEVLVEAGDLTGPLGARTVLEHPDVEVAVLETARGGLLLRGLGYESNDVAVLTNVSADHMDLQGLHTLPELAEVKSTIARVTPRAGIVVLNAEDPLAASVARSVRARVCYFALSPATPPARARIARHLARGGVATVQADGWLVELQGGRRRRIARVSDVPVTIGGAARHNVANALAAAAAARGLGVSLASVSAGLRTFKPTAAQAPGRLNVYRSGVRLVIVDFAHNEAGVRAALETTEAIVGAPSVRAGRAWLSVIVGTAGDRPDDTLHAVGRLAGEFADDIAIKETLSYLRGRTRQSVIGEIRAGIAAAGRPAAGVPVYEDEAAATLGELTTAGRLAAGPGPGVLLVLCHAGRARVEAILEGLAFEALDTDELAGQLPLAAPPITPT
jgi:cyanophycin synthetase